LATLGSQATPTLVFDEVDSGIGGGVAETVGKLLRKVGTQSQVLCVTHLPQVAAQANNHLLVTKDVDAGKTRTFISALDTKGTQQEIARMLGGSSITDKTLQHAQEMLESVS
ncbi:MAG: DNA repair protein RecN, partial [Granulosicoccus sp.]